MINSDPVNLYLKLISLEQFPFVKAFKTSYFIDLKIMMLAVTNPPYMGRLKGMNKELIEIFKRLITLTLNMIYLLFLWKES